jgi:DEAD/DEAH box helicase domain-containing protein
MGDEGFEERQFGARPAPPWAGQRGLASVLSSWRGAGGVRQCLTLDHLLPGQAGRFADMPAELHPSLAQALRERGITQLYSHQAEAFALARDGKDFVAATPTASGKSLCYNLPVLDALARDPAARAIYLFPTKALARDQEEALKTLLAEAGMSTGAITYDGDTPGDARRAARERTGIMLTNPDMLHSGILPHHASWSRVFANLRYVVIDELHTYRGVFGSHLANVLRRLLRIAAFHGSQPRVLFASATIGNPREHASRIVGREVTLIGESGAPMGPRHVLVYNPPVIDSELGIRQSYVKAAVRLTSDLVQAGVPTLVFGQSKNTVETMLKYLRDRLARERIDPESILSYRGGYLPETRRRIEAGLRAGEVRCVVATNALELGIDIGSLDAVVCAGYPGSVASLWQRFGRAGRRREGSLALFVASSAPLDQYCATDPQALIGALVEHARIDPDNVEILVQHLKCAAFELPFEFL